MTTESTAAVHYKDRKKVWITLGAAATVILLSLLYLVPRLQPEVFVQWFEYQSNQAGSIQADVLLGVRNNAPFDIEIQSVDIDLQVEGREVYRNTLNRIVPLPSGEVVPIPLSLSTSEEFVMRLLGSNAVSSPDAAELTRKSLPYKLTMRVHVSRPFDHEFLMDFEDEIPAFRIPDIAIVPGGFRISRFDLFRPELRMQVEVFNPNEFDVGARNLEFDVHVYGRHVSHVTPEVVIDLKAGQSDVIDFDFVLDTMKLGLGGIATLFRGSVELRIEGAFRAYTPFGSFPVKFAKDATVQISR